MIARWLCMSAITGRRCDTRVRSAIGMDSPQAPSLTPVSGSDGVHFWHWEIIERCKVTEGGKLRVASGNVYGSRDYAVRDAKKDRSRLLGGAALGQRPASPIGFESSSRRATAGVP